MAFHEEINKFNTFRFVRNLTPEGSKEKTCYKVYYKC